MRRYFGKYQQICEDILENISKCAKIFGQISEDVQKMFWQISADLQRSVGKYQKTRKELWATISSKSVDQYQQTRKDLRANISRRAKIYSGQI